MSSVGVGNICGGVDDFSENSRFEAPLNFMPMKITSKNISFTPAKFTCIKSSMTARF